MTELENYIHASFGIIDKEELSRISALFEYSELKMDDFLLKSGEKCNTLSFVQSA
ncbi:MAG TPA: hypothetical protein VKY37_13135 [Brumimicrobium sp.]|nr:hypothetical protein [Brumimicrobium sp.]